MIFTIPQAQARLSCPPIIGPENKLGFSVNQGGCYGAEEV